jgi:two-component system, sensor histidine kinase and response regulator
MHSSSISRSVIDIVWLVTMIAGVSLAYLGTGALIMSTILVAAYCYRRHAAFMAEQSDLRARLRDQDVRLIDLNGAIESAFADRDRFLAQVSHEIRTPLNGVLGMLRILSLTELTREQREYANGASTSGQTLMRLLNELIAEGLERRSGLRIEGQPFDLAALAEGVVANFKAMAAERSIILSVQYRAGVPRFVSGHEIGVHQILNNLVHNAVKFTERGSVSITIDGQMRIGALVDYRIIVSDTGAGIAPDQLATIFAGTGRVDRDERTASGGAGLGLSIVRSRVEGMNGSISVASTLGAGTEFTVLLQLGVDTRLRQFSSLDGDHDIAGVLLIVDAKSDAVAKTEGLRQMRAWVDVSDNGDDAWALLTAAGECRQYSLIILSAQWACEDQFASALRGANVPVITSSLADEQVTLLTRELVPVVASFPRGALNQMLQRAGAELGWSEPAHAANADRALERAPAGQADSATVLVVDDDAMNLFVLRKLLQNLGVGAVTVGSGSLAIDQLSVHKYAAVFMDLRMPGMSGTEATRAIRAREVSAGATRVPVIATTANSSEADRLACIAAGMDDMLPKPIDPAHLVSILDRWVVRKSSQSAEQVAPPRAHDSDPELSTLFVESGAERLRDLKAALDLGDAEAASLAAHTLKSMARHLGFTELGAVSERLEREAYENADIARTLHREAERRFAAAAAELNVSSATPQDGQPVAKA